MGRRSVSLTLFFAISILSCLGGFVKPSLAVESSPDFNRDILPILSNKCFACHGPDEATRKADLRLDRRDVVLAVGVIHPGDAEGSELVTRILSSDPDEMMPPPKEKKRLSPEEKDLLRAWIADGAQYTLHWSFLPLSQSDPPETKTPARNPIDRFILAELEKHEIAPSPEADPNTLIRRMFLDLTGLLPPPDRVQSFLTEYRDDADAAVARLADQLLASPHYGERWGRHWLDQARYADSNGYSIDGDRSMWPYRDWVIHALNQDMPFDRFTIEQIAGDLLPQATKDQFIASGFHRNTLINQEGGTDPEQFRNEAVTDRVNTTGAVWLGLTLSCAECHTHKFDPITQREYFEMFAFFNQGTDVNDTGATVEVSEGELFLNQPAPEKIAALSEARASLESVISSTSKRQLLWEKEALSLEKASTKPADELAEALCTASDQRSSAQRRLLASAFAKVDHEKQTAEKQLQIAEKALGLGPSVKTMVMRDLPVRRDTLIHLRGSFLDQDRRTGPLRPGVPAVLPPLPGDAVKKDWPDRLDLAHWLARPDHPLVSRVTVNRIWMRYFGRGIVETENDFGSQGSFPTHPALLDWLARSFIEHGWSMKWLHRQIVTSATYRRSSHSRPELGEIDPLNQLLARQNRLRVEAEIVRDIALSASGLLDSKIGGPGIRPPQPDGVYAFTQTKKSWETAPAPDRYRRSLYIQFYRSAPYPMLTTFDSPDFQSVCTARVRSNTPLQSLMLANDEGLFELAQGLAEQLLSEDSDDASRLERAFSLCYSRPPSEKERELVARFHDQQYQSFFQNSAAVKAISSGIKSESDPVALAAWTAVARALMNTDEFITRE